MDIKILKDMFLTIERGNPLKCQDQIIYKRIMVYPGLLKSGKVENGEHDRSGQPDRNSWNSLRKVDPHREEYLLGRTAHSARNEETIHDRTGQPVSENLQGKADFENFIMGSEITEFVNKVRNQVRIRQKKNVKHCRELCRTFNNMVNVYCYNIECSDIYGKEFFNHAECCEESRKSYIETDV